MARRRLTPAAKAFLGLGCLAAAGAVSLEGWSPPAVALLPSCSALPGKTCFAERVNVYSKTPDAGPEPGCTTCLQSRACCDAVGACDDDQACIDGFRATHACVIDGGPSEEARCKRSLTTDTSRQLYDCMRGNCASSCGVPDCTLDKAVILIANPACDRCMGGACCKPINDCYGIRQCKLAMECITTRCDGLGPSMTALGLAPHDRIEAIRASICAGTDDPAGVPDPCLAQCLDEFAPRGDAGTPDDQAARCLAFSVYACGAEAQCGPSCDRPDSGPYASQVQSPPDRLDAGAHD
jgi:hypothetical protein